MSSPTYSLIVAVYDVERCLPEFLDSLSSQAGGLDDVELVFVIDGSPDDSETVIRDWASGEGLAPVIHVQENAGVAAARNAGLACAKASG